MTRPPLPPLAKGGRNAPLRGGFTLIELLVVVTIIGILATLTLGVVGGLLGQARDSATKATISKIQGLLNSRSQAFDRLLKRQGYLTGTLEYQAVERQYGAVISQQNTKAMLATKLLQAKFFPQRYQEIYDQYIYAKPAGIASIYNNPSADSCEILYDFLTQSNSLGPVTVGTDTFSASEVKDTDNDGLPEFIDGWGRPLRFYRWPTRLFRPQGQNAGTGALNAITAADVANVQLLFSTLPVFSGDLKRDLARDPNDPLQDCYTVFQAPNLRPFENLTFPNTSVIFHTPATYHVMLVVSAGPDGVFGMYAPDVTANFGHLGAIKNANALTDDIISLNIRAGGK